MVFSACFFQAELTEIRIQAGHSCDLQAICPLSTDHPHVVRLMQSNPGVLTEFCGLLLDPRC